MTIRRQLIELLANEPRSASSLARELGLHRGDIGNQLRHAMRSASAAGHLITVVPARCKACGYVFGAERLTRPGRCPSCGGSRILEPLIRLDKAVT